MTRCNWPCKPMRWLVSSMAHHIIFYLPQAFLSFVFPQVDKHIRRLDTDLARFEADLKEKQIESTDYDSTSSKGKKGMCAHSFPLFLCSTSNHVLRKTLRI